MSLLIFMKECDRYKISRRKFVVASILSATAYCLTPSRIFAPKAYETAIPTPQPAEYENPAKQERSPVFGIRNDIDCLMEWSPKASFVRIAGDRDRFETTPDVKKAIDEAKKNHLDIYYTDNPQKPISVPEIERKVESVINYAGENITVIGSTNEVDQHFWEGDFATVAPFILYQSDYIFRKHQNIQVAIGGLAIPERMSELIYRLKNPDFKLIPGFASLPEEEQNYIRSIHFCPERYIYTFHAYYGPASVIEAITTLKDSLAQNGIFNPTIWGEEIGRKNDKSDITEMLDTALNSGAEKVIVHELSNIEGYGYMNTADESLKNWTPNEYYPLLLNWAQTHLS